MFGSKPAKEVSTPPVREAQTAEKPSRSVIAGDLKFIGDIEGDADLMVEGKVEGNIRCRNVTVGSTGEIRGRIDAQEVTVFGAVFGEMKAKIVRLMNSARMFGDVSHEILQVEPGAEVEGRYSRQAMIRDREAASGVRTASDLPKPPVRPQVKSGALGNSNIRPIASASSGSQSQQDASEKPVVN